MQESVGPGTNTCLAGTDFLRQGERLAVDFNYTTVKKQVSVTVEGSVRWQHSRTAQVVFPVE